MSDTEDKFFHNDPIYMRSLVGKKVEVQTVEKVTYSGIVYVIDPIYKTLVLHTNRQSEDHDTVIVLYHAIASLKVFPDDPVQSYVKETDKTEMKSSSNEKKNLLKKWLNHMLVDVYESGDFLKIGDHMVIVPPYGPENCICNNTLLLERIQKLINRMPQDFT